MAIIFTADEFCKRLVNIANNYKTLYVNGCFGAPMSASNKKRYTQNTNYNKQASRTAMINAASADTFGFDCVNLAKGVLWGWTGDKNKTYGGANYGSNGVPDCGEDKMISMCSGVSTDFKNIVKGEALWIKGHFGVYIGDGLAVECTPAWKNKVQITAVKNIGTKNGYNSRQWTKHGKLPWIDYSQTEEKDDAKVPEVKPEPKPEPNKKWIYKCVDYSPVFDPQYYRSHYKDVVNSPAFGNSDEALFKHFCQYGMNEVNRRGNDEFNVLVYKTDQKNSDLRAAFGEKISDYYKHYCIYGINETWRVHK